MSAPTRRSSAVRPGSRPAPASGCAAAAATASSSSAGRPAPGAGAEAERPAARTEEEDRVSIGSSGVENNEYNELHWLRRWRRSWGVTWGSFQSRDTVTVECGQKKACCSRLRGHQFGARELPQGRTWAVRGPKKRGRIAAPKSGPPRQFIRPGGPQKRTLFLKENMGVSVFW